MRIAIALLAAVGAYSQDQLSRGMNLYSAEKEAALGAQLARETRSKTKIVENDAVLGYVQQIGTRLIAQLPGEPPFPYTFAITAEFDSAPLEPQWLPGGYIFVPASLILAAQDEAEFAGVLAHAIIHVGARHATRLASREHLAQQASIPLVFVGGWTANAATMLPVGLLQVQRQFESEADLQAVKLLSSAGYEPSALVRYLDRVQKDPAQPSYSAFPLRGDRVAAIAGAIAALPDRTYTSSGDLSRIQAELRAMVPAERPAPSLRRAPPQQ
jgi:predicted Zn-dependent protease